MNYLGYIENQLKDLNGIHTAREIQQQPGIWLKIYDLIRKQKEEIESFMKEALRDADEIILTGAGTSAFIGLSLSPVYKRNTGKCIQAIATTDLVTHPKHYFNREKKVLLISFARSGNSPESCAAVDMAEKFSARARHLVITCNAKGNLLGRCKKTDQFNVILPEETNDKSLAMTSSFTGMLLAGLLINKIDNIDQEKQYVENLAAYGKKILTFYRDDLYNAAQKDFRRIVFLGSGPQMGTATESHLKVQELTDGKIIAKSDSFLGFRHGPKAVIDTSTLVVGLFSNDPYVLRYEYDLIKSLKKGQQPLYRIGIFESETIAADFEKFIDLKIILSGNNSSFVPEDYLSICNVLPAQMLGFFKSLERGLCPDNPSETGAISRVVEGVHIYSL